MKSAVENLFDDSDDLRQSCHEMLQQIPDATWQAVETAAFEILRDRLALVEITQRPLNDRTLKAFIETFAIAFPDEEEDEDEEEEEDPAEDRNSASSSDDIYEPIRKKIHVTK